MAAILEKIAKLAIPAGLAIGGVQSAMYDGNVSPEGLFYNLDMVEF